MVNDTTLSDNEDSYEAYLNPNYRPSSGMAMTLL